VMYIQIHMTMDQATRATTGARIGLWADMAGSSGDLRRC
jgi:hypothetical protein